MACLIAAEAVESIRVHAAAEYPKESCGLLVGRDAVMHRTVTHAVAAANVDGATSRRFTIAPEDFLRAERTARERGLEVVGFYHSHPDVEARPSAFDRDHAWSGYSYVIVSVRGGTARETRSWELRPDRSTFDEEGLFLAEEGNSPLRTGTDALPRASE